MRSVSLLVGWLVCFGAARPFAETVRVSVVKPLGTWKLAFVRDTKAQRPDIWIARGDGTGQRLLIRNAFAPCWSPDRKRLAFARENDVWIANADGTGQRQLTFAWHKSKREAYAEEGGIVLAWNPTDNRITFSHNETYTLRRTGSKSSAEIAGSALFAVSPDTQGRPELERILDIGEQGTHFAYSHQEAPAWSQSGKYLAFARNGDIWIAEREERRSPGKAWDAWKWEITRLAAVADFDDPNYRGSRTNLGVTRISWSPDGKTLVYGLHRLDGSGVESIHLLRLQGGASGALDVRENRDWCEAGGIEPCFSPDGRYIAYTNWYNEHSIYYKPMDGGTARRLISDAGEPAW